MMDLPDDIILPMTTLLEVDSLEAKLVDITVRQTFASYIKKVKMDLLLHVIIMSYQYLYFAMLSGKQVGKIGGGTLKDAVRRVMGYLVTSALSMQFNWEGRLGWKNTEHTSKHAFNALLLTSVITHKF